MSIKLMTKVWEHGPEDRTETMVLLALADRANDDGSSCYPSMADVAQRARLSRRGAQKVIQRLESKGYLSINQGGGRGNTNDYQLHPQALKGRTEYTESDEKGEPRSEKGEPDSSKGRTSFARNRQEPSKNRESAPAREDLSEDPVTMLKEMWDVRPSAYQADGIRQQVDDMDRWFDVLHDLKMQSKDSKKAIGWAVKNYEEEDAGDDEVSDDVKYEWY